MVQSRPEKRLRRALLAAVLSLGFLAAGSGAATGTDAGLTTLCQAPRDTHGRERTVHVPEQTAGRLLRTTRSYRGPCAEYGTAIPRGDGFLRGYTQRSGHRPVAMGVTFTPATLRNLPTAVSDGTYCFDKDGDGRLDLHTECAVGHEGVLDMPEAFLENVDTPFNWSLTNYNPMGHIPPGVYDVPHFDVHFYIQSLAGRNAIRTGPCPVVTDCDDYARAKIPVPGRYVDPVFKDLDAVEPAMGNHLIDDTAPEFHGVPFTHTWIYGAYDGEVSFYEAMITTKWFEDLRTGAVADRCVPFRQPRAWRIAGWYPTTYCMEYRENRNDYVVSMNDWVYRTAS
ncbi:hypothetical protein SRB5_18040 [Streptomyces sp. RB5]|uniref:DUF5602 domain-containing protein n=1 Tax=Streptomyces smaragdinus TaxID=2585196 RepID=A0A7K0CDZ2_9ACTN|nr:hypothetical protein [Streptomyces smaragdinus]MQY11685.1 hypothetical protein [Streptomyces smaragdinus]